MKYEIVNFCVLVSFFCLLVLYFSIDPTILSAQCSGQCKVPVWPGEVRRRSMESRWVTIRSITQWPHCRLLTAQCSNVPLHSHLCSVVSEHQLKKTPVFLTIIWLFLQASLPIFPCLEVLLLLLGYLEKVPNSRVWLLESYQNKFWAHHNKFWAHQNKFWSEKKRHCSRMSSELIRRDWNWRLQRRHRARAGPCTGTDPGTGTNLIILEGVAPNIYWLSVFGVLFTPFCMQIFSLRIVY